MRSERNIYMYIYVSVSIHIYTRLFIRDGKMIQKKFRYYVYYSNYVLVSILLHIFILNPVINNCVLIFIPTFFFF